MVTGQLLDVLPRTAGTAGGRLAIGGVALADVHSADEIRRGHDRFAIIEFTH